MASANGRGCATATRRGSGRAARGCSCGPARCRGGGRPRALCQDEGGSNGQMQNPAARSSAEVGHAADGTGPDGAGAPDLERALRADAAHRDASARPGGSAPGSSGRGRPGRPQKGGAHSASQPSPSLPTSSHSRRRCGRTGRGRNQEGNENEKSSPATRPPGVRERRATRSSTTSPRVRPLRRVTSSPSTTWADQMCVAAPWTAPDQSTATTSMRGVNRGERAELGHCVPVPGGAHDAEPPFQERAGEFGAGVAVWRVDVDLLADDDQLVTPARGRGEGGQSLLARCLGEEGHVVPRRVGALRREGAGGHHPRQLRHGPQDHRRCLPKSVRQLALNGRGQLRTHSGRASGTARCRSGCRW